MVKTVKAIIDFVMDILETIVFVGSIFIVVYLFILTPNQVKGDSMEPNFHTGDYILTSRITYKFRRIERGDVVVLKSPKNPDIEYIKRVIGLPGETLVIKDGIVSIDGKVIQENYISDTTNLWEGECIKNGEPYKIPEDEVFVMGDNRPRSSDSRKFCSVPINSLVGQVFYRYFPPGQIGWIKNPLPETLR
ncbi:MAG: signal peptidase I [Patescibacteria group bacterium]|nr:signal peptidase I [Patescibacteria group bacterium]